MTAMSYQGPDQTKLTVLVCNGPDCVSETYSPPRSPWRAVVIFRSSTTPPLTRHYCSPDCLLEGELPR